MRAATLLKLEIYIVMAFGCDVKQLHPQALPSETSFDVISIRPTAIQRAGEPRRSLEFERCTGTRFVFSGAPLLWLVEWSYDLPEFRISGFPSWVNSFDTTFDIEAKTSRPVTQDECRQFVRSLLSERFGMVTRTVAKMSSVYFLTVSKDGSKMDLVRELQSPPRLVLINGSPFTQLSHPELSNGINMPQLAKFLAGLPDVAKDVVDKTGLNGIYTFSLEFSRSGDDDRPRIFSALQSQLGLKLTPARSLRDTLVVDRFEKPSPN